MEAPIFFIELPMSGPSAAAPLGALRPRTQRLCSASNSPTFFGTQEGIPTIDPACLGSAVYLVRNPLDVLPSLARHLGMTFDRAGEMMTRPNTVMPAKAGRAASEPWYDWSSNVRSWTEPGPPRLLVVKYEDLLASPKHVLGRIARRFGLNPTDAQLKRARDATALDRLQEASEVAPAPRIRRRSDRPMPGG